jgi:hypothetical protein
MPTHRTDPRPDARRRTRVKAEAAEGGGATALALTRVRGPRNNSGVSSGLTDKTVAMDYRHKPIRRGPFWAPMRGPLLRAD